MTTTDTTELGAGAPLPSNLPPADFEGDTPAPDLPPPPPPPPEPLECPHIRTAAEWIANRPEGQKVEHAIESAADWASRNAPNLYTLAQAVKILRALFHR